MEIGSKNIPLTFRSAAIGVTGLALMSLLALPFVSRTVRIWVGFSATALALFSLPHILPPAPSPSPPLPAAPSPPPLAERPIPKWLLSLQDRFDPEHKLDLQPATRKYEEALASLARTPIPNRKARKQALVLYTRELASVFVLLDKDPERALSLRKAFVELVAANYNRSVCAFLYDPENHSYHKERFSEFVENLRFRPNVAIAFLATNLTIAF